MGSSLLYSNASSRDISGYCGLLHKKVGRMNVGPTRLPPAHLLCGYGNAMLFKLEVGGAHEMGLRPAVVGGQ